MLIAVFSSVTSIVFCGILVNSAEVDLNPSASSPSATGWRFGIEV